MVMWLQMMELADLILCEEKKQGIFTKKEIAEISF